LWIKTGLIGWSKVDLDTGVIAIYALRRREPTQQGLLRTAKYQLPKRASPLGRPKREQLMAATKARVQNVLTIGFLQLRLFNMW
jgi:hypothetical protein